VPEEVLFATKPQLAGALLDRAHRLGIRAAFVAGDEVYGGRELRRGIRQRGMGYVLAVRANHALTIGSGRTVTAAGAADLIPVRAWHRMRTGSGTKGMRHYDWAMLEVTSDDTPPGAAGGHSVLLARRHRYTGQLSFYRCWTPGPVPLSRLIAIASARWRIEIGHLWYRSSCAAFSWLRSFAVAGFRLGRCPAGAAVEAGRACPALA
jgi:SRSO17 transposase